MGVGVFAVAVAASSEASFRFFDILVVGASDFKVDFYWRMCVAYTKSKRLPVLSNSIELNYIFREFSTLNSGSKKHIVTVLSSNIGEIKLTLRKNFPFFLNQFVPNL